MLRWFRPTTHSLFCRCAHILSVVFVFSYIAFEVLDLDLSDLTAHHKARHAATARKRSVPLRHAPLEKTVVITEALKVTEIVNTGNPDGFWIAPSLVQPATATFKESIRIQQKNLLRTSRFRNLRLLSPPRIIPPSNSDSSSAA